MVANATAEVLRSLTRKIAGEKPDLRAATGVINDIGRVLAGGPTTDARALQAEVASLREELERCKDVSELKPSEILQGQHGRIFLAGAMWGADEMMSAYVAQSNRVLEKRSDTTARVAIVDAAMQLLRGGQTTPTAIRRAVEQRGVSVRPDQISKALGELIARGKVAAADGPEGSDRRSRYYKLAD
ncbi:hypothetical protein [Rhodococcoides kyotonense]|uniref:Uncharacterized protein n=1 Tax=Rhodococcoides kyotonense TaxID=398843 RepID=A0A239FIB8_9NOCA|nr:hypothetical protein [Rhodococcus kyotonensis]SNS56659.1 hypothetical protein SAMN05421642_103309 [Rhodococcus kyotonensis]